jgi:hypothetical protein
VGQQAALGGGFHQEVVAGKNVILTSNSGAFAFFNRDGSALDAGFGNGNVVTAAELFDQFVHVSSPIFINANLPPAPPSSAAYANCDATHDAPSNANTPAFSSSCIIGDYFYDSHSTYDPVHDRFILATHVRNNNWTNPVPSGGIANPGPGVDPYCWRYLLIAVSKSENPADGFYLYQSAEYYSDWPRVGVSGNYYVVSYHGESSYAEYDAHKPVVTLYLLDDLAAGVGAIGFSPAPVVPWLAPTVAPRSFGYGLAQLPSLPYQRSDFGPGQNTSVGFLVVPTHDEAPDPQGPLLGTAYVMTKSSDEQDVPQLLGFVPSPSNPSAAPTVMSASMPASYKYQDPTSATIRDKVLYATYADSANTLAHLDQLQIATTHNPTPTLLLTPNWSTTVAEPAGFSGGLTGPLVEATADGSAVLSYSVRNLSNGTISLGSRTFSANGTAGPETIWASAASDEPLDTRWNNRSSYDPSDPQAVWIMGVVGNMATGDLPVAQQVFVNGPATPWCQATYSCYGYSGASTISCPLGLTGLTLLRQDSGPCPQGACTYDPVANVNTTQVSNAFVDYVTPTPVPGTQIYYEVLAQDANGSWALTQPMYVTSIDCSCHPDTQCGGGLECGTIDNGCGGTLSCGTCTNPAAPVCSDHMCCPTGQSWSSTFNTCVSGPPKPCKYGDCGGYCCPAPCGPRNPGC